MFKLHQTVPKETVSCGFFPRNLSCISETFHYGNNYDLFTKHCYRLRIGSNWLLLGKYFSTQSMVGIVGIHRALEILVFLAPYGMDTGDSDSAQTAKTQTHVNF